MNILRVSAIFLLSMILLPDSATAHCKGSKHTGDHPHCTGEPPPPPPPPPPPAAASCPGDFPAFAYALEITDKRGQTERLDLYLANSDGSCQILLDSPPHTRKFGASYDDLNFLFDSASGFYRIAYKYNGDEADTKDTGARPNIRVMQFSVSTDAGETTIDQALPLDVHKIYRYSRNSTSGRALRDNQMRGNSLVFTLEYGESYGSPGDPHNNWFDEIWVIEDIGDCIANYSPEPDENCAELAFAPGPNLQSDHAVWGLDTTRIYFRHDWSSIKNENLALGILDRSGPGSPWSAPGAVSIESDDGPGFLDGDPVLLDYGIGPREVLNQSANGVLQFLEIGSDCTAANTSTLSCLTQGTASVVSTFPSQAQAGKWTTHGSIDAGPNLLYHDRVANSIREFDPDTKTSVEIIGDSPGGVVSFDPVD